MHIQYAVIPACTDMCMRNVACFISYRKTKARRLLLPTKYLQLYHAWYMVRFIKALPELHSLAL